MSEELVGAAAITFRYVVAFVLLAAAVPKLMSRWEFERAVENYALLPSRLVRPVADWLPRAELGCAVALLAGIAVAPVAVASAAFMLVFAVAVALNLGRGRRIECGCYSSATPRRIGWPLVVGDIALATMATTAVLVHATVSSGDGVASLMLAALAVLAYLLLSSWASLRSTTSALAARAETT